MSYKPENLDYVQEQKIYTRPGIKLNFIYSDGEQFESSLLDIFRNSTDLSVGSEELQKHILDWRSLYHLSPKRADILRPFTDQLKNKKILEIGAGCGAITRFLGELGCFVISLEASKQRAIITAERCRDLENVTIVNDGLGDFLCNEKFDFVILAGVLEYGNIFMTTGGDGSLIMLTKAKEFLSKDGKLIIAIENKIGLKYWTGAPEDHMGKAYYGIQNLYSQKEAETFGYNEIVSLLTEAGLGISEFMYPFPDYKFADVIITDTGFTNPIFDPCELLFEKFEYFQNTKYSDHFSSTLAALSLFNNNLLPHFANSFLITASAGDVAKRVKQNPTLAYVYSTSRKKQYCKQTIFSYDFETKSISVKRKRLYEDRDRISQYLAQSLHDEVYIPGQILLSTLLPIVSKTGWTTESIVDWARTFYEVVISRSFRKDNQYYLAGKYVDLTPFNIILSNDEAQSFDLEWICDEPVPAYYVFFRGLAHGLGRILFVNKPGPGTPTRNIELAAEVTSHYFQFTGSELRECKERERKYFSGVAINEMTEPFSTEKLNTRDLEYLEVVQMNNELSSQNINLSNELKNNRKQLGKEIFLHHETKKREINSVRSIQALRKDIKWYVDTYVNRSLMGVIRQKLSDNGFPFLKRAKHSGVYTLTPGNHILYTEKTKEYRVTGDDPYIFIDLLNENLEAGWYWLDMEINSHGGKFISSKFCFNTGNGFNETDICFLPAPQNGKITGLVNFNGRVCQLRFVPCINDGAFKLEKFSLRKISKSRALAKTIRIYKNTFPRESNWSILQNLFVKFKRHGVSEVRRQLRKMSQANITTRITPYIQWCGRYDTITSSELGLLEKLSKQLKHQPLFSIIMPVYDPPLIYLQKAIDSVITQPYLNWELCIADDCSNNKKVKEVLTEYQQKDKRIKVVYRPANGHISEASNTALQIAEGEFVVLLDQDDQLSPHALYLVAEAINENPDAALLYSDEDKIDEDDNRFDPYFKSDWNPDLFMGQNLVSHLGVYKRSIVKKIGGFRKGFEGSQDYDLALRFIQHIKSSQVIHIPHILYHWRASSGSTAISANNKQYAFTAGLKALKNFVHDQNWNAEALPNVNCSYRIKWNRSGTPKVSIVIPTKDKAEVLFPCINSILLKTKYPSYEIIIVDNNSEEPQTAELFSHFSEKDQRVLVERYGKPFNFSAIINYGVSKATGEILVILNNDTEVINEEWLEELVSHAMRKNVGAVGAKLLYPDGSIQHAGVFFFKNHPGIHIYQHRKENDPGYFNKLNLIQNYSAVTAACLAVKKELYDWIGGLDEQHLSVAYNDVDFCLRLREKGFYNVWTPFSLLYHHESLSRGDDFDEKNVERFNKEHRYMLNRWKKYIDRDPCFNPNLSPETLVTAFSYPPNIQFSWRRKDFYHAEQPGLTMKYESMINE